MALRAALWAAPATAEPPPVVCVETGSAVYCGVTVKPR